MLMDLADVGRTEGPGMEEGSLSFFILPLSMQLG